MENFILFLHLKFFSMDRPTVELTYKVWDAKLPPLHLPPPRWGFGLSRSLGLPPRPPGPLLDEAGGSPPLATLLDLFVLSSWWEWGSTTSLPTPHPPPGWGWEIVTSSSSWPPSRPVLLHEAGSLVLLAPFLLVDEAGGSRGYWGWGPSSSWPPPHPPGPLLDETWGSWGDWGPSSSWPHPRPPPW